MTPEERQQFQALQRDVAALQAWMSQKKRQQISFPLDTISKTIINNI